MHDISKLKKKRKRKTYVTIVNERNDCRSCLNYDIIQPFELILPYNMSIDIDNIHVNYIAMPNFMSKFL